MRTRVLRTFVKRGLIDKDDATAMVSQQSINRAAAVALRKPEGRAV